MKAKDEIKKKKTKTKPVNQSTLPVWTNAKEKSCYYFGN